MQQSARRLAGIATLIVFAVSGFIYSRYGYAMLFPTGDEFINRNGDIAGGDFLVFYNAVAMTMSGAASSVWDFPVFEASLLKIYGQNITQLHFFNPPVALLIWGPLGLLHHVHALWLWTAVPLIAFGWLIFRLTGSWLATGLTMIAPLTAYTAGSGQTGIMFAVLMAGFMLTNERYPARAGSLAALVAIKPHLAFAMPICFLIDRNWRALSASVVAGLLLMLATSLAFGFGIWMEFFEGVRYHSGEFFHDRNPAFDRTPSVLLMLLMLGIDASLAWAAQIAVSVASLAMLVVIWRSSEDQMHKAFALGLAICLFTPKVMHYDAMVLLIPIAMLIPRIQRGTADMKLVLLSLLIWCLPYFEPGFKALGFHPGSLVFFTAMTVIALKYLPARRAQHSAA